MMYILGIIEDFPFFWGERKLLHNEEFSVYNLLLDLHLSKATQKQKQKDFTTNDSK